MAHRREYPGKRYALLAAVAALAVTACAPQGTRYGAWNASDPADAFKLHPRDCPSEMTVAQCEQPPPAQPTPPPPAPEQQAQADVNKRVFCETAVYPMARAAYCSIWRKKCGQPPAAETKDEIVKRLFGAQSVVSGPYWARQISSVPLMSQGDIASLVQEAINYSGDMNSFARDAFAHCQTDWDQNEKRRLEKRLKENVTH